MSFPKHKKPEKKPVAQGAKKSATRKGQPKVAVSTGGARGEARSTRDTRYARSNEGRKVTLSHAEAPKAEGRRSEPRPKAGQKPDPRRPEAQNSERRKLDPRRLQAQKNDEPGDKRANRRADEHALNGRHARARHRDDKLNGARAEGPRGQATRAPRKLDPRSAGGKRPQGRASDARRVDPRAGTSRPGAGRGALRGPRAADAPETKRFRDKPAVRRSAEERPDRTEQPRDKTSERFAPKGNRQPRAKTGERFAPQGEARRAATGERFAPQGEARRGATGEHFAPKGAARRGAVKARVAPRGEARRGKTSEHFARSGDVRRGTGERLLRKQRPQEPDSQSSRPEAHKDSDQKGTHTRPFRPRPSSPAALLRAEKPVERKRPDMGEEPHPGHFLLTCRQGSEQDLVDELVLAGIVDPPPRVLAPALVLAPKVPKLDKRPVELTFARQGFPIVQSVHAHDLDQISQRVSRSLRGQLEKAREYGLHVWVPDSELGNPLAAMALELEAKITAQLAEALPGAKRVDDTALRRHGSVLFAQVCLIDPERAVAGVTYSNAALSLARGGRTRVRVSGHFPSRAARKLEEAFAWLNLEPGAGELCVDLGAAPGGWTFVLAERRARVIAVDPAHLRPEILAKKGVSHVQQSAFDYKPEHEVDWLFCDMAWRPLEAAALLAKWGRNRWARLMIANIKLPMTKKAEIVARVKHILETEGDWKNIRVKQLYHDRDEVTLSAHVQ